MLFNTFPQLDPSGISFELDGGTDVNIALAYVFVIPIGYCATVSGSGGGSDCSYDEGVYFYTGGYVNLSNSFSASASTTPLPATLPLFAGGLGFVGYLTGRKKRKAGQTLAAA